jgi:hypothetical protein
VLEVNRASALKALDDAMADGIKLMLNILVQGVEGNNPKAAEERFNNGLRFHLTAYSLAEKSINEIIGE